MPRALGQILPLSGARVLSYRDIVRTLSDPQKQPFEVPVPAALLRFAARALSSLADPPITEAQLTMILEGLAEETASSWALLGITPRAFGDEDLR